MRSNGAPVDDSCVILARMSRQRCACSRRVLMSPASWLLSCRVRLQLARNQEDRRQRRAEFVRGGGGKAVELGQMLLARQHQFGRGQRVGELAGLLGDLERVEAGDADREHDREPDAEQVDRRQHQRFVAVPRQRQMKEDQRGGAGDREQRRARASAAIGSAVAEISTGARNRNENGFCSPPVKNSRPASSTMLSASSAAA